MNIRFCILFVSAVALLMSLWACATTTLNNVWMDESYTGKVKSVLVLGATQNQAARQMFESELSRQLTAKGVKAIPSFPLFSGDDLLDKKIIVDTAHEKQVDSVIVTKVLDSKEYTERVTDINSSYGGAYSGRYRPYGGRGGWYGDYSSSYTTARSYDYQYVISNTETALYQLDGERMIWSVLTETEADATDMAGSISEMAKIVVEQLVKDGLI